MALDATVGGALADSYLSVAAADALAEADIGTAAAHWRNPLIPVGDRERALKRATREIEAHVSTSGVRYSATQRRLYPRAIDAASSLGIISSTVASPTIVRTVGPHGFTTGQSVTVAGHTSTPAIGTQVITVLSEDTFSVPVNVTVAGAGGTLTNASLALIPYIPSSISLATYAQAKFLLAGGAEIIDGAAMRDARGLQSASEPNVSYTQATGALPYLSAEAQAHLQGVFGGGATIHSVKVSTDYTIDAGLEVLA
jgi:hypothetical protein